MLLSCPMGRGRAHRSGEGGEEAGGEDVGAAQRRGEARRYQPVAAWDLEEEGVLSKLIPELLLFLEHNS